MKHIKLFEELNKKTYLNAAKKLKNLGGIHLKRAKNIEMWAYKNPKYIGLGTFNLNWHIDIANIKVTPGYFHAFDINWDYYNEVMEEHHNDPKKSVGEHMCLYDILCGFDLDADDSMGICAFDIYINVKWITENSFIVSYVSVGGVETKMFSDRQSAMKFKREVLSNEKNWIPQEFEEESDQDIKYTFMKYSTAEEYKKMINMVKNIPISQLYK